MHCLDISLVTLADRLLLVRIEEKDSNVRLKRDDIALYIYLLSRSMIQNQVELLIRLQTQRSRDSEFTATVVSVSKEEAQLHDHQKTKGDLTVEDWSAIQHPDFQLYL